MRKTLWRITPDMVGLGVVNQVPSQSNANGDRVGTSSEEPLPSVPHQYKFNRTKLVGSWLLDGSRNRQIPEQERLYAALLSIPEKGTPQDQER